MKPIHALNSDYFHSIDAEEKAYWLGFIAADGCVTGDGKFLMALAAKDAAHVERFRAAVGYGGKIRRFTKRGTSKGYVSVRIGRKRFVAHLNAHGILPRKTWGLGAPGDGVPAELLRHYYRGLFDGDGSISRTKSGRAGDGWMLELCGTRAAMEGYAAFVAAHANVTLPIAEKGSIYLVRASGLERPQIVARLLYENATIFLARKKARADELLAHTPKRSRFLILGGVRQSLNNAAVAAGVLPATLRGRVAGGMTPEQAAATPNRRRTLITARGETRTVRAWARLTGLNHQTIHARLKRGDTSEQALRPVGT